MKLNPGLGDILKAAAEKNVAMGGITNLDEGTDEQLVGKLGLSGMGVQQLSRASDDDRQFPSADGWLKLAKNMGVMPPLCVVVASSATACRSALSAGMPCAVVSDKFTAFQDFSGAHYCSDGFTDDSMAAILGLLESRRK